MLICGYKVFLKNFKKLKMNDTVPNDAVIKFSGPGVLLRYTWTIFRKRVWVLVLIIIIGLILSCVPPAVVLGIGLVASKFFAVSGDLIIFTSFGIAVLTFLIFSTLFQLAFTIAVTDQDIGIKESFKRANPNVFSFSWLITLLCLLVTAGCVLFFIPGILFTVWFFFAPFTFITEGARGMDALIRSMYYVKERWRGVFGRLSVVWPACCIISVIPVIGQILAIFLIPFAGIYSFLIYENLRLFKNNETYKPPDAKGVILTGVFGIFLISGLMSFFILTGKLKSAADLKQLMLSKLLDASAKQSALAAVTPKKEFIAPPLSAANYISGKVVDSKEQPVYNVTIKISQNDKEKLRAYTGRDGRFKTEELPFGAYEVKAWQSGYRAVNKKIDVKKDLPAEIRFVLIK